MTIDDDAPIPELVGTILCYRWPRKLAKVHLVPMHDTNLDPVLGNRYCQCRFVYCCIHIKGMAFGNI